METIGIKTAIGSVMLANVHPHVAASFAVMLGRTGRERPEMECNIMTPARVEIASARNACIDLALRNNVDYFFWMDDDTQCPPDTIVRLLDRLEKHPDIHMISPKYYVRGYPYKLMAFEVVSPLEWQLIDDKKMVPDADGLVRCAAIGNGCTLTRMSVFKELIVSKANREWYRTGKHHTEDAFFCAKAKSVIPEFTCAIDTTFTAKHQLGTTWLDADNVDFIRLKHRLVSALIDNPKRINDLEALIEGWGEVTPNGVAAMDFDGSLGRI